WYTDGISELRHTLQMKPNENRARNVILFVGDGMGMSTVAAARIFEGQLRNQSGEENVLTFEELPYLALAKTYNTDRQVGDSAGAMTAIMTGVKTRTGLIGLNQNAELGNCKSAQGNAVTSFLEQAAKAGMGTGIVTTTRITHATPAATYAHAPHRDWESDKDMPAQAREQGCKDLAVQLVEFPLGGGIDVVLGGGRGKFMPNSAADPEGSGMGEREDKRDLIAEWTQKYPSSVYVWNDKQFASLDPAKTERVLGLFNRSDMNYEVDRKGDAGGEPSLTDMTKKAVAILKKKPEGFFLMVEGGRIDHAHHAGNAYRALDETREFASAVRAAMSAVDMKETLIIVTADHGHALTISGTPKRGNAILGKMIGPNGNNPAKALDERPYTTLNYMTGPGAIAARDPLSKTGARRDLGNVDTSKPDYMQQALIPLSGGEHSGEDVPIYAGGPWAQLFHRTVEQNYIYQVMRYATFERPKAPDRNASKTKPRKQKATRKE